MRMRMRERVRMSVRMSVSVRMRVRVRMRMRVRRRMDTSVLNLVQSLSSIHYRERIASTDSTHTPTHQHNIFNVKNKVKFEEQPNEDKCKKLMRERTNE
jgi:hypothetical protein